MMKQFSNYILLLVIHLFMQTHSYAQINELPRATPESQGVPSKAIMALFDSLTHLPETDIHSVIVIRHGKVIGEMYPAPFAPEYRHTMYSCSKTFVGAAIGLAIQDNLLRLTDRVATFFPEMLPDSVSHELADMTIQNLLTMTSGITPDWNMRNECSDWIHTYLSKPIKTPGVTFAYDSMSTYMLSAILQKITGMTLLDYLKLKLFNPMNIQEVAWEKSPEGINTGGWGLHIQSESLAKFGLLLLNRGKWKNKQLIPESWIDQMTNKQMEAGEEDYGYQTWQCTYPGAFRADGALGQYILIVPSKDAVIVITECTLINGKRQRGLVWEKLLPAMKNNPLPPSHQSNKLWKKQQQYTLPLIKGKATSRQSHLYERKNILLPANKCGWKSFLFDFKEKEIKLTIEEANGNKYTLPFGYNHWITSILETTPPYSIQPQGSFTGLEGPFRAAGNYAWTRHDILQLKVHYVNWVSALDLTLHFHNNQVDITIKENFSNKNELVKGLF